MDRMIFDALDAGEPIDLVRDRFKLSRHEAAQAHAKWTWIKRMDSIAESRCDMSGAVLGEDCLSRAYPAQGTLNPCKWIVGHFRRLHGRSVQRKMYD